MIPFRIPAALLLLLAVMSPSLMRIRNERPDTAVPNWIEGGYVAADTALPVMDAYNCVVDSTMWNQSNAVVSSPARERLGSVTVEGCRGRRQSQFACSVQRPSR
jgi:hypothetical protein